MARLLCSRGWGWDWLFIFPLGHVAKIKGWDWLFIFPLGHVAKINILWP